MKLIEDLLNTETEVLKYFHLDDKDLNKSYDLGKWNVRQILHHLADAESVLYERIRRGISKPGQIVWGFDQDAWCEAMEYNDKPLEISQHLFVAVRKGIVHLAEKYYISHGDNVYVHNETGKRTVREEFEKVVWHCEHHLEQIRRALKM